MEIQKRFFYVGVFDGSREPVWPWFFEHEGTFLSESGRICKMGKAIKRAERKEAVKAFDVWVKANVARIRYKLHIVECIEWVEDTTVKPYPDDHPFAIIMASDIGSTYKSTAHGYFYGWGCENTLMTSRTRKKHRNILLDRFGVDIDVALPEEMKLTPVNRYIDDPFSTAPKLTGLP